MIEQFPILAEINPGLWVILAGLLCTLLPIGHARKAFVVAAPIFAGLLIFQINGLNPGAHFGGELQFGPVELTTLRIDKLSVVWGYLFCLAGVINLPDLERRRPCLCGRCSLSCDTCVVRGHVACRCNPPCSSQWRRFHV